MKKYNTPFDAWFEKEYPTVDVFHKEMMRVAFVAGQKESNNDKIRLDWLDELAGGAHADASIQAHNKGISAPKWIQITRSGLGRWTIEDSNNADWDEDVHHYEIADAWGSIRELIDNATVTRALSPKDKNE